MYECMYKLQNYVYIPVLKGKRKLFFTMKEIRKVILKYCLGAEISFT